jgi:uncharacterized membrane protein YfcA
MSFIIIPLVALLVSALTLFSGFGLGTLLMPAFALFFPIKIAVAATAIVHLANNLFKIALVGKYADRKTVIVFAVPAAIAAFGGAMLLSSLSNVYVLFCYQIGKSTHEITPVNLVLGLLIFGFALFELIPKFEKMQFDKRYLPLGGLLSGFFGGLSGMQGALRSAFLAKSGLQKEAFIGTNTVSAVVVDVSRLMVYGFAFYSQKFVQIPESAWNLVGVATLTAFAGAYFGKKLMKKVTIKTVQNIVGAMLLLFGTALGCGLIK